MAIKAYRPYTKSRREMTTLSMKALPRPLLKNHLLAPKKHTGGRNNQGCHHLPSHRRWKQESLSSHRLQTSERWHQRHGQSDRIRPEPHRLHRSHRLRRWREALHHRTQWLKVGDVIVSGKATDIKVGNCCELASIPDGTMVHNIELQPGKGAQMCRAAGAFAQVLGSEGQYKIIRLASSEVRKVLGNCRATIGVVGNQDYNLVNIGTAGKKRHFGVRPTVRGFAMNPCDHPHGGGEGKCPVGRDAPRTPWGKKSQGVKTRKFKKNSTRLIMRRKNDK
jgi:large subunit ribosomal protein L2